MSVLLLLTFFSALLALAVSLYVLRLKPRTVTHIVFALFSLCIGIWTFGYTFIFSATTQEEAWFWYRISAWGWTIFPSFGAHFALSINPKHNLEKKWWVLLLIYSPAPIMLYHGVFGNLIIEGFRFTIDYWNGNPLSEFQKFFHG
jgi:hypothetical protein